MIQFVAKTQILLLFCLYSKNVKTAKSIGPNYFVVTHMSPGTKEGIWAFKSYKFCLEKMIFKNLEF